MTAVDCCYSSHVGRNVFHTGVIDRTTMSETEKTERSTESEESLLENEKIRYAGLLILGMIIGVILGALLGGSALAGYSGGIPPS